MNNFLYNTKQKIILCRKLEIVYVENSEQFFWENSEQFYLIQKTDFMNALNRYEYTVKPMCRVQILLTKKHILSMHKNKFVHFEIQTWKSIKICLLKLENKISLGVLWENGEQFF